MGKKILILVGVMVICLFFISLVVLMWHNRQSTVNEYFISEVSDGCYGVYTTVHSSIPAQNYEQITLCVNGSIRSFRGHVNIHFVDSGFKLILEDSNMINSDTMDVYVPRNSIVYTGGVTVVGGRRH